jgi:predicted RNA methylase
MRWSVSVVAEGDRVVTREEIVELADAVAGSGGIASGIGTASYGAQLVIEADTDDAAVEKAVAELARAAEEAGLPDWPAARAEVISEDEDLDFEG